MEFEHQGPHSEDKEPFAIRLRHDNHTKRNRIIAIILSVFVLCIGVFAALKFSNINLQLLSNKNSSAIQNFKEKAGNEITDFEVKETPIAIPESSKQSSQDNVEPQITVDNSAPSDETTNSNQKDQSEKAVNKKAWELKLANANNVLNEAELSNLSYTGPNYIPVDSKIIEYVENLILDAKNAGYSLQVVTGYRSYESQKGLFEKKVNNLIFEGMKPEDAEKEAAKFVAVPGTSDHNTGLGIDIIETSKQDMNDQFESFKWLCDNAQNYGFILRYPSDKTSITGFSYEPWHWRYVGIDAAKEITDKGITLEEYLAI